MRSHGATPAFGAFLLLLLQRALLVVADIDPITIKGSHFFYQTNGSQFFVRGVAYQVQGRFAGTLASIIDPLADGPTCARDIPYLQQLRTNTLRVYAIDPTKDHTVCMQQFADAGIYVMLDLAGNELFINRTAPAWSTDLYARYTSVIDNMQQYNNTLGFIAGDQLSNDADSTTLAGFERAAIRDMKLYMAQQGYRYVATN